jgi:type III restriction enzyme
MTDDFFEHPILNSPYAYPAQHWELDEDGQPTNRIEESRRESKLMTPVPRPQRRRRTAGQTEMVLDAGEGLSTEDQEYNPTPIVNEIRRYVEGWRNLPISERACQFQMLRRFTHRRVAVSLRAGDRTSQPKLC